MKRYFSLFPALALMCMAGGCKNEQTFDASGAFEAEETVVSSQSQGVILRLDVEEGAVIDSGATVGCVDTTDLSLTREQLVARIEALTARRPETAVQLAALEEQLATAVRERERVAHLVAGDAATGKQLDDATAQVAVLQKQIAAQRSTLRTSADGIDKEARALAVQVEQMDDRLRRCHIVNPTRGTVMTRYVRANEMTAPGQPLYRIADLSHMTLRVYITGDQLSQVRLGQRVNVFTDSGDPHEPMHRDEGTIFWISDRAEFTPKTIRTRDERADLVYAVKVRVQNPEGRYKMGMYGEITFQ
ncbi:membrane protein [Tannerella sp. oral taxon BU063 isolate Cell 5]|uniref:Membrane protein n=1 Tax=Tannerella sp. oral taxon BU063 isolate Cell 5 TaxID=1410950 RepID=W2CDT1_9BACT|nr:membrane protein [Tannerella sp. oral taxon BU063 isolate Cell 5]